MRSVIVIVGIIFFLASMSRCSQQTSRADIGALERAAEQQIASTEKALRNGSLANAMILKQYAKRLTAEKPEFSELARTLASEATPEGALYQHLLTRKKAALELSDEQAKAAELSSLAAAADPGAFNDALLDPINTIADVSGGTLARIKAPRKDSSESAAAMVGNPAYGQWQSSPSGGSFWMWYGAYRMLDDVINGGSRMSYNRWQNNRPWSYHNDYGKSRHGSRLLADRADKATGNAVERGRRASSYGRAAGASKQNNAFTPTARRASSYETTRRPASNSIFRSGGSRGAQGQTSTRRRSNFGFSGSLRNSGSRSRGGFSFGGK